MPATNYDDLIFEGENLIMRLNAKYEATRDLMLRSDLRTTMETLKQAMNCVDYCTDPTIKDIAAHACKTLIDALNTSPAFGVE